MAAKIFDKDTILDLTVNIIPIGIIAFFVVVFAVANPFGTDFLGTTITFGLLFVPLIALAVLTYISGKAIAGDEKRDEVYLAGQATVPGAQTLEEYEESAELSDEERKQLAEREPAADESASANGGDDTETAETTESAETTEETEDTEDAEATEEAGASDASDDEN